MPDTDKLIPETDPGIPEIDIQNLEDLEVKYNFNDLEFDAQIDEDALYSTDGEDDFHNDDLLKMS